jgi:signal transduction histidine kinase
VTERVVPINLIPAVAERVAAWQPVADAHGVKLVTENPGDGEDRPRVSLGVGHLEQILDNLLDNAIEALSGRGGRVTVTVANSDAGATLTVADDGPGMNPQERSRAFLRFSTGTQNGTGLGLAIVQRLVTSNGGTVRLEDTRDGGLTVILEFPGTALHDGTTSAG